MIRKRHILALTGILITLLLVACGGGNTSTTSSAKGNAEMTGIINNVPAIPSNGWYVNVHYSTDLTNQAGADAIVCGDVIA